MKVIDAALLGMVQGVTEFLPVSSSGHLVFVQNWLHIHEKNMLAFDILLHWGTLLAAFAYFRCEIGHLFTQATLFLRRRPEGAEREHFIKEHPFSLTAYLILLSTLATGLVGLFLWDFFESLFDVVLAVGVAWLINGLLLLSSAWLKSDARERALGEMHHQDAFLIGLMQGVALIPGISRSGSTIWMGLYCGINRKDAARYSFLLGIAAVLGVGFLKVAEVIAFIKAQPQAAAAGVITSALVGYAAVHFLFRILLRGKLHFFGIYSMIAGLAAITSYFFHS